MKMVEKDGIQYRPEDAERLGIKGDTFETDESKTTKVIRAGDVGNRARAVNTGSATPTKEKKSAAKAAEDAEQTQQESANTPPQGA